MKNYGFPLFVSIVVAMFSASPSFAQVDPVGAFNRHVFETWKGDYIRVGQYRVKGSPYFLGTSFNGSLLCSNNSSVTNKKILYNLYTQKVGTEVNNELFELDSPVSEFSIQVPVGEETKILQFKNSSVFYAQQKPTYLNVIADGAKFSLLKQFKVNLIPDPSNELEKDRRLFEQYFDYYIYRSDLKTLKKIRLNKKDIVKEIGSDEKLITYLKENDVDFSKEKSIVNLINFLNG